MGGSQEAPEEAFIDSECGAMPRADALLEGTGIGSNICASFDEGLLRR
jgi:hypothetical protein